MIKTTPFRMVFIIVWYIMDRHERICSAREAKNWTREQLARQITFYLPEKRTIAARTIAAREEDHEPKVTCAIALAKALGYHDVSELLRNGNGT